MKRCKDYFYINYGIFSLLYPHEIMFSQSWTFFVQYNCRLWDLKQFILTPTMDTWVNAAYDGALCHIYRLNFIPLWERTWCHRIFYVIQDWNLLSGHREIYLRLQKGAFEMLACLWRYIMTSHLCSKWDKVQILIVVQYPYLPHWSNTL